MNIQETIAMHYNYDQNMVIKWNNVYDTIKKYEQQLINSLNIIVRYMGKINMFE